MGKPFNLKQCLAAELAMLESRWSLPTATPVERAALSLVQQNRYRIFPRRDKRGPYLLRLWVSPPVRAKTRSGTVYGRNYDAQDSLLMHYFWQGDDDKALHDHPWDFTTRIMQGWYEEHLPSLMWLDGDRRHGPKWDKRIERRSAGDTVNRQAAELHCVGKIAPGTMTLVQTGFEKRKWGFHPYRKLWVPAATFLKGAD